MGEEGEEQEGGDECGGGWAQETGVNGRPARSSGSPDTVWAPCGVLGTQARDGPPSGAPAVGIVALSAGGSTGNQRREP